MTGEIVVIFSSHGRIEVDASSALPVKVELDEGQDMQSVFGGEILKFDFGEWRKFWGTESLPYMLDILDVGYWYRKGEEELYEPAVMEHRKIVQEGGGAIVVPGGGGQNIELPNQYIN